MARPLNGRGRPSDYAPQDGGEGGWKGRESREWFKEEEDPRPLIEQVREALRQREERREKSAGPGEGSPGPADQKRSSSTRMLHQDGQEGEAKSAEDLKNGHAPSADAAGEAGWHADFVPCDESQEESPAPPPSPAGPNGDDQGPPGGVGSPNAEDVEAEAILEAEFAWFAAQERMPKAVQDSPWMPEVVNPPRRQPKKPDLLGGILYPGRTHLLWAEDGSMKTWLALHLASLTIRRGKMVLWIDNEGMGGELYARLRAMGREAAEIGRHFRRVEQAAGLEGAGQVMEWLPAPLGLIVIDSLSGALSFEGADDCSNEDVEKWWQAARRELLERCHGMPPLLVIDHQGVDGERRRPAGSRRKRGGVDVGLQLQAVSKPARSPERDGRATLTVCKDRFGWLSEGSTRELRLRVEDGGRKVSAELAAGKPDGKSSGEAPGFRPTCLMEKVSQFVEANPGCSQNRVMKEVPGKDRWKKEAIRTLTAEGFLTTAPGDRNSIRLTSARPFRAADRGTSDHLSPLRPDLGPAEVTAPQPTSAPPPPTRGGGRGRGGLAPDAAINGAEVKGGTP